MPRVLIKRKCHTLFNRVMKIAECAMSDIGDINSPRGANVGSRSTRVDPKSFCKPSDFSGDRREWRHFEWYFVTGLVFVYDTAEEWLGLAASAPGELGEAVPESRETDWALYMSLAMVCKNEALDVVNTVTHKRGFESWASCVRSKDRRLGCRCTSTRIFWSKTSEPLMDSRRNC